MTRSPSRSAPARAASSRIWSASRRRSPSPIRPVQPAISRAHEIGHRAVGGGVVQQRVPASRRIWRTAALASLRPRPVRAASQAAVVA